MLLTNAPCCSSKWGMIIRWIAILCIISASALAQAPQPSHRDASTPYSGDLSIFEEAGRDRKLQVDRVMDLLEISPGKSVADIGAGSGWLTVRAARRVTNSGRVYAVDISSNAVRHIIKRATKEKLANVTAIASRPDDPLLPGGSVDAVLLLKTYHEIQDPVELLKNLRPALRAGAKVGIIDRNGNAGSHGVDQATVVTEAEQAGYRLLGNHDFVKGDGMDYFLIFAVAAAN
jgi:SAM-dependent methyltransferase